MAEREYVGTDGRAGYDEIIKNAIKDGRVLNYNVKKRDDLSVIAESAGLGNITKSSLENNLSRFKKEVKSFREKNKISYQDLHGEEKLEKALVSASEMLGEKGVAISDLELRMLVEAALAEFNDAFSKTE